jgi:hypothetical protein
MFGYHPDLLIFKVKIAEALNYTRVDSKWYDEYRKSGSKKFIKKYWKEYKYDESNSSWEYLVDGLIIVEDQKNLLYLESFKKELEEEFNYKISTSPEKSLFVAYV